MIGRAVSYALLCAALVLPSGAAAQSDRPDPDSPAGVEYELPLDQPRRDLGGGSGRDGREDGGARDAGSGGGGPSSGAAPLFGAGISPSAGASADGPSEDGDGARGSRDSSAGPRADAATPGQGPSSPEASDGEVSAEDPDRAGPALAQASTEEDSGSTGLLLPGLALAVLLAGGGLGLLLRGGSGRTSDS